MGGLGTAKLSRIVGVSVGVCIAVVPAGAVAVESVGKSDMRVGVSGSKNDMVAAGAMEAPYEDGVTSAAVALIGCAIVVDVVAEEEGELPRHAKTTMITWR